MDKIQKFLENEKNQEKAKDFDSFMDKNNGSIKSRPEEAFAVLVSLNPATHTVPIIYLLIAILQNKDTGTKINIKELIVYMRRFLYEFNVDSINTSSFYQHSFCVFIKYFSYTLLHPTSDRPHWHSDNLAAFYVNRPMLGIKPLKKAIEKLQTKDTEFTICHSYFALLCVCAKAYRQALPIVTKKILSGFNFSLCAEEAMNYNYYRGLIFTGLEKYDQAKHCFQLVLDTPYHACHILQVNAFKKLVLLIWLTSTHNPNDTEHKSVRLSIKSVVHSKGVMGKHLEESCYNYCKAERINNFFIVCNKEEIEKDINMGLVKQVIKKLRNEILESLTQTNTMLGIGEIGERLASHREFLDVQEEQEKNETLKKLKDKIMDSGDELTYKDEDLHTVLFKMIKDGRIKAKIDMAKNIVVFAEEDTTVQELVKKLEVQNMQIIQILKEVEGFDKELILNKKAGNVEIDDPQDERDILMMDEY